MRPRVRPVYHPLAPEASPITRVAPVELGSGLVELGLVELGFVELGFVELGLVVLGLVELGLVELGLGLGDGVWVVWG